MIPGWLPLLVALLLLPVSFQSANAALKINMYVGTYLTYEHSARNHPQECGHQQPVWRGPELNSPDPLGPGQCKSGHDS